MKLDFSIVYHYTGLDTLFKMLDGISNDNIVFFASKVSELNDSSEFIYGLKKLWNWLPYIEKQLSINDNYKVSRITKKNSSITEKELLQMVKDILSRSQYVPFIVSFSNNKDSLPMWDMYGNNGYGVALGFKLQANILRKRKEPIMDLTNYDPTVPHSWRVSYGDFFIRDDVLKYVMFLYRNYYESTHIITDKKDIFYAQSDLIREIATIPAVLLKHPAYKYEEESRLIFLSNNLKSIKFRNNRKGNVIQYIEVEIPVYLLKEIVIGPCFDVKSVKNNIQIILDQKGLKGIKIIDSKIPYRDY